MKNFAVYKAVKYLKTPYLRISDNIYQIGNVFVTSLSFMQEPELGEGVNANDISQFPLEDILDAYRVYVSDFYDELNTSESNKCYLEFASYEKDDVSELLKLVGHRVYNKTIISNGEEYQDLIIEWGFRYEH